MTVLCVRFALAPGQEAAMSGLLALLGEFTPVVQALPPDGALADLGGAERYFGKDAVRLAEVIRVRALAQYGVDCVAGVGPSPVPARIAAAEAEPGRPRVVAEESEQGAGVAEFLSGRPVAALPGVGAATARTLGSYGLDTLGLVAAAPLPTLQRLLGARAGRELHERARGVDRSRVVPDAASLSLAAERGFDRDELDPFLHRRALLAAAGELGARLRGAHQVCGTLSLTVRCVGRTGQAGLTRSRRLPEPSAHSAVLSGVAYRMYDSLGLQRARVRGFVLRAEGLGPAERAAHQLSFDPVDDKLRRIEEVADRARAKFGPQAVMPGTLAELGWHRHRRYGEKRER
ncbi:hypothetical protein HUT18_04190 [Streptomyces sp. NA04227]|uniref:DNA polymerase Y family protein n=1 Tax=Streptomyces sp. NA04227 TaxID=2742136 RepID=UPI00159157DD|nr:hypothetical protein [Streptomyces sp. NA04227]QKW05697.1 hypothetical protein HUT18_04190 [Streptomyces sp. NA04227]